MRRANRKRAHRHERDQVRVEAAHSRMAGGLAGSRVQRQPAPDQEPGGAVHDYVRPRLAKAGQDVIAETARIVDAESTGDAVIQDLAGADQRDDDAHADRDETLDRAQSRLAVVVEMARGKDLRVKSPKQQPADDQAGRYGKGLGHRYRVVQRLDQTAWIRPWAPISNMKSPTTRARYMYQRRSVAEAPCSPMTARSRAAMR